MFKLHLKYKCNIQQKQTIKEMEESVEVKYDNELNTSIFFILSQILSNEMAESMFISVLISTSASTSALYLSVIYLSSMYLSGSFRSTYTSLFLYAYFHLLGSLIGTYIYIYTYKCIWLKPWIHWKSHFKRKPMRSDIKRSQIQRRQ